MNAWLIWPWALLAVVVIVAAVTDCRRGMIYNWLTYPAMALALVGHGLASYAGVEQDIGIVGALIGLAWSLPLLIAWLVGGVGGGDAKLLMVIGLIAGYPFIVSVMVYGLGIAAVMAIILIILRRRFRSTMGRVGRFLWLVLARGKPGDPADKDSPMVPLGLALALGAVAATVEWIWRGLFPYF